MIMRLLLMGDQLADRNDINEYRSEGGQSPLRESPRRRQANTGLIGKALSPPNRQWLQSGSAKMGLMRTTPDHTRNHASDFAGMDGDPEMNPGP